jgi:hypothetical protein
MHEQQVVGEAIAGRSAHVRKELARMVSSMSVSTFDMIVLLAEAQEHNYAPGWGFSSLVDYGAKELGLKKRKTQYLARIGYVTKAVGLKRAQYEPAGTSKLREITVLDPEGSYWNKETHTNEDLAEHIVRLILDHDKMTVEQVHDEVLRLQGRTGPDRPVIRSTSYPRSVWENVIQPARELARRLLGSSGRDIEGNAKEYPDGACDEVICAAFLADVNNSEDMSAAELLGQQAEVPKIPMEEI